MVVVCFFLEMVFSTCSRLGCLRMVGSNISSCMALRLAACGFMIMLEHSCSWSFSTFFFGGCTLCVFVIRGSLCGFTGLPSDMGPLPASAESLNKLL